MTVHILNRLRNLRNTSWWYALFPYLLPIAGTLSLYILLLTKEILPFEAALLKVTRILNDNEAFKREVFSWHGLFFRPVTNITLWLNYQIHGTASFGYLFVNVVLHCLNVVWIIKIARKLNINSSLSGFLFGIHPLATGAVSLVYGRGYLLGTFFSLWAITVFLDALVSQKHLPMFKTSALFFLAILSKQTFVSLPFILIVSYAFFKKNPFGNRTNILLIATISAVISYVFVEIYAVPYARTARIESLVFLLSQFGNMDRMLLLYLFPINTCLVHDMPLFPTLWNINVLIGIFVVALLITWALKNFNQPKAFLLLSFFIAVLPTNSFVPKDEIVLEWRLYFSLSIISLVLSDFLISLISISKQRQPAKLLINFCLGIYLILLLLISADQILTYRSSDESYQDALRLYPNNRTAIIRLSKSAIRNRDFQKAKNYLERLKLANPEDQWIDLIIPELDKKISQNP